MTQIQSTSYELSLLYSDSAWLRLATPPSVAASQNVQGSPKLLTFSSFNFPKNFMSRTFSYMLTSIPATLDTNLSSHIGVHRCETTGFAIPLQSHTRSSLAFVYSNFILALWAKEYRLRPWRRTVYCFADRSRKAVLRFFLQVRILRNPSPPMYKPMPQLTTPTKTSRKRYFMTDSLTANSDNPELQMDRLENVSMATLSTNVH